jgi:chemotaxis protein CheD
MDSRNSVRMGEAKVATGTDVLVAIGLGSCVGVALYDARVRVSGLAHVMLPYPTSARRPTPPGRFGSTAVEHLLELMAEHGAVKRRIYARIVGGASMFESVLNDDGQPSLGDRNVEATRIALKHAGIPLKGEAVGGNFGRTVQLYARDGKLLITSVRRPDVIL